MKLQNRFSFLIPMLCLFWPIGLIYTLKSDKSALQKWLLSVLSLIVFLTLLLQATVLRSTVRSSDDFDVVATRTELSVGQSGGLSVVAGRHYFTDYTISCSNDVLAINHNIYTATKSGECALTISFDDQVRLLNITVNNQNHTDETVYASPIGKRYHKTQSHAGSNGLPFTEEEALMSGKTPCKICWK